MIPSTKFTGTDLLGSYKNAVDASINANYYVHDDLKGQMVRNDFELMPDFIARANQKDKELNAHFVPDGISGLTRKIEEMRASGISSARFVVNVGPAASQSGAPRQMGYHFAAFDYVCLPNGKSSLIGIDPARASGMGAQKMFIQLNTIFSKKFPDVKHVFIETDIQKSQADCGIFSLAFVKKMSQEKKIFDDLHNKNIHDSLPGLEDTSRVILAENAYDFLPASFMKHGHSRSTLNKFLQKRPEAIEEVMSQKISDETQRKFTLESWQSNYRVKREINDKPKEMSRSIEFKRQKELNKLMPSHADSALSIQHKHGGQVAPGSTATGNDTMMAMGLNEQTDSSAPEATRKQHRVRNAMRNFFNNLFSKSDSRRSQAL